MASQLGTTILLKEKNCWWPSLRDYMKNYEKYKTLMLDLICEKIAQLKLPEKISY